MKSMTGFGRHKETINGTVITVELKSVNHRYLDLNIKTPRIYGFLDEVVKKEISKTIFRGKIDAFITIDTSEKSDTKIKINENILREYLDLSKETCEKFGIENDIKMSHVLKLPDILAVTKEDADVDQLSCDVVEVLKTAILNFNQMRQIEGKQLKNDVLDRCDDIFDMVKIIEEKSPETTKHYQERLHKRLLEVLQDSSISQDRILAESAVFADKTSVCEETVRLFSHISQLREMCKSDGAIGRKLDFLIQEFNREANTIGSKATDSDIAKIVIDLKSEIEKIREQIQNVE